MSKLKIPPTPDEIAKVKAHFKSHGYGDISDETASAQIMFIGAMRDGKLVVVDEETGRMDAR